MSLNVLTTANIFTKIEILENHAASILNNNSTAEALFVPDKISRDIEVLGPKLHPDKKGLSQKEGHARMLHDLASIELQAMELALRTLIEYDQILESEFPRPIKEEFQNELYDLTLSEGRHLKLCLEGIEKLGFKWGDWPVHTALWDAVSKSDSLLDRILIVNRYLEGSGLDAGDTMIRRLNGVTDWGALGILKIINAEEVDHVLFGTNWYHQLCRLQNLDPENDFKERVRKLRNILPKRVEKINIDLRKKAGFTDFEIEVCEDLRQSYLIPRSLQ